MTEEKILKVLKETDYVRTGGSPEELKCAEYLRKCCNELEVEARIEDFEVQMRHMKDAKLVADGEERGLPGSKAWVKAASGSDPRPCGTKRRSGMGRHIRGLRGSGTDEMTFSMLLCLLA